MMLERAILREIFRIKLEMMFRRILRTANCIQFFLRYIKMNKVNQAFLHDILIPLAGLADDDEQAEKYSSIDPNDEDSVKSIINATIIPYIQNQSKMYKDCVKDALSYFLTQDKVDFEGIFDSNLLPFPAPTKAKLFFVWIWELLFEGKSYIVTDLIGYVEINDIYEPLALRSNNNE